MTRDEEIAAAFADFKIPAYPVSERAADLIARALLDMAAAEMEALERKEREGDKNDKSHRKKMRRSAARARRPRGAAPS
ncbi:MAG: hypothetical protein LLG00_13610 [Planctomycetaceae bacterium]|nr:hypothetical protein [Planctomycetaceae bacterium]